MADDQHHKRIQKLFLAARSLDAEVRQVLLRGLNLKDREEVESLFWVPLDFFLQDNRLRTDIFSRLGSSAWVPAYDFEGKEIWGFTAAIIKIFLRQCLSAELEREHSAPEKHWSSGGHET